MAVVSVLNVAPFAWLAQREGVLLQHHEHQHLAGRGGVRGEGVASLS